MQMRLWQMSHITGIWNPTGAIHDPVLQQEPAEIPPGLVDPTKENIWVPDGFVPPGWEDMKFQTFLALILNDKAIFGDRQYSFSFSEAMGELRKDFPHGAAILLDELTNPSVGGSTNDIKRLSLITQAEASEREEEKRRIGLGQEAR